MIEQTYQMLWDCPYCGTDKLLGLTHRHCPSCGSAQAEDKRYFPSDEDKVAVADHKFSGADKDCPACSSPMAAAAAHCGNCGSPMDGAAAVKLKSDAPAPDPQKAKGSGNGKLIGIGCVVLLGLGLVFLLVTMLWKKDVTLEATSRSWERSILIEAKQPTKEAKWCDNLPRDAYAVTRSSKQRDTKKIPDGETCTTKRKDNGDGTFNEYQDCKPKYREEPIYDEWCAYTADRWHEARTLNAAGDASSAPDWPTVTLAKTGECVGCEREGKRSDSYVVQFLDADGKTHDCDLVEARWAGIEIGSKWTSKASVIGGSLDCKGLERAP
ncbi:MAG: zinc ribbon domain-containing protein [Proteobacteria bacterium]|nr:zinc ribbon domain-containing protein [Pseudomonadota bacterium]